jgi:hypothetical protein
MDKIVKTPVRNKPARANKLEVLKRRLPPRVALIDDATKLRVFYRPLGKDAAGKRFATSSVTVKIDPNNPEAALDEVQEIRKAVREGRHPGQERRQKVAKNIADRLDTVDEACKRYSEWLPHRRLLRGKGKLKPATVRNELADLRNAIESASLGRRSVASLGKADVMRVLEACAGQENAARHRFNALSKFCARMTSLGLLAQNPCLLVDKVDRPRSGGSRNRAPRLNEWAAVWNGVEPMNDSWRDFVRTDIALPARRNEIASMDFSDVDFERAAWTIPGKITKNGDPHALHLHRLVFDLLKVRHEAAGEPASGLVFPAPRTGKRIVAFSALKRAVDRLVPQVKDWSWHDARRSFASTLGEHGVAESVADAILNHRQSTSRPGVLGVYQKSSRMPEQIAAMQRWGALLEAAIKGETAPADNAVSLHA